MKRTLKILGWTVLLGTAMFTRSLWRFQREQRELRIMAVIDRFDGTPSWELAEEIVRYDLDRTTGFGDMSLLEALIELNAMSGEPETRPNQPTQGKTG